MSKRGRVMTEQETKAAAEPPLDCLVSPMPCPFCGGKVELKMGEDRKPNIISAGYWVGNVSSTIRCSGHFCVQPYVVIFRDPTNYTSIEDASAAARKEALGRWNTRANASVSGAEPQAERPTRRES